MFGLVAAACVAGTVACSSTTETEDEVDSALEQSDLPPIELTDAQRNEIVEKKATCPFASAAIAMKKLFILNSAENPLARIVGEGSVAALGDTGRRSNLGTAVLTIFARGNHRLMRSEGNERSQNAKLDRVVPAGTFSLEFPGSQGSHPGHSGILQGDPTVLDSGRFSAESFQRLVAPSEQNPNQCAPTGHAERTSDGKLVVRRSEIAKFIAENLKADPKSRVIGKGVLKAVGIDTANFAGSLLKLIGGGDKEDVFQALTKLTGEDNLVGSAGEFGLLMAFLENSPKTVRLKSDGIGTEPALSVEDLSQMFSANPAERRFPEGWETWTKSRHSWVVNTIALTHHAAEHHLTLGKCSRGQ